MQNSKMLKIALSCSVSLLLLGCFEAKQPLTFKLLSNTYVSNDSAFKIDFSNQSVLLSTPVGVMRKTYKVHQDKIELLYLSSTKSETTLFFYPVDNGQSLSCAECAKYNLPTFYVSDPK